MRKYVNETLSDDRSGTPQWIRDGWPTTPFLDLTGAPTRTPTRNSISAVAELPLSVTLVGFADQAYTIGERFYYEVELANHTNTPIAIPWSPDPAWLDNVPAERVFSSSISLLLGNNISRDHVLAGAFMYGDPDGLTSVHTLNPGTSVRLRASGHWSVSGVNFRQYLPLTDGRLTIKAVYRLQTGTLLRSTAASQPSTLTLVMPPQ